mgnify:CR=1 FL=1
MKSIMKNFLFPIFLVVFGISTATSQSFWFGAKSGLGLNRQQWSNFNRQFIATAFGDALIESYDEEETNTLYAMLGYHLRGSGIRFTQFQGYTTQTNGYIFRNLVLELGVKRALGDYGDKYRPYYIMAVRGEYTLSTNLDEFVGYDTRYFPHNDFVNKFNYGITFGAGYEWTTSNYQKVFLELAINPDVSYQYDQPALSNVRNPYTGTKENLSPVRVRNLSFEIKVGVKFLRKVTYID